MIDLVTCLKCNDECATCSNFANNCTKCSKKFFYLSECIDACPEDFYVNDDMACIACSDNPDACVLEPLKYTIHPFTENYKLHAYVVFNREVDMTLN